ncbi:MAG TPA: hypothetical protein PK869_06835 [Candidatus Hydrogenedentes bacterium]|nr:hypothetical protein [Candidatus Hydrogenedentota bacterium]
MMRHVFKLYPVLFLLAVQAVGQSDVIARVELDAQEIPWHKSFTYSIIVEAPSTSSVVVEDMKERFGGLVVFGNVVTGEESIGGGIKRITHRYTLESPEAKAATYQPEDAIVRIDGGEVISLPSPPLRVRDLTPEEEELAKRFAPTLDPLNVPRRLWEYWQFWAGLAAAAVIGVGLFLLYLWLTRTKPAAPIRMIPAWELANERIAALESKRLIEANRLEPFYTELSTILRQYIEDRFAIHAPERTTPEFLVEASTQRVLSDEHQRMIGLFLRYSDRVKFAKHEPTQEEARQNLADIRRFIEQTIPAPQPSEEAAA